MTEIDKQERTNRDTGLENIVESMYSEKHETAKCDHCGGTGKHGDQDCKKCGGDGWIDAKDVVKEKEADDPNVKKRTPALFGKADQDKKVHWTKDIKAKLAKAQEIGDSKEANRLQRFLDTHGVDEAYVKEDNHDVKRPTGATDCKHCGGDGKHDDGSECPKCKGKGWLRAPVQPSSPARLSRSPHRPSGMSGPGMMP